MCEHSPDCGKVTDPLAKALSEHPREDIALVLVYCPKNYHVLAAVYDEHALGGLVMVTPHFKVRHGSLFRPDPSVDPDEQVHWHAAITPMDDIPEDESWYGRCRCGTWMYKPSDAMKVVQQVRSGTWEGIDPDTFVKVKNHKTGGVGQVARAFAENHLLPKGDHEIIGRAPRSNRLRRPYTLSSYVQMADADTRKH